MSPGELAVVHDTQVTELFPFRFFDPIRGRWIQARYKATPGEIAARYEKWEITGPGWTPSEVEGRSNRAGARPTRAGRVLAHR